MKQLDEKLSPLARASTVSEPAMPHGAGRIRLSELYTPPSQHRVHPLAERVIGEARTWMWRYLEPLGAGRLLERCVEESLSMCAYLYPEAEEEGLFLSTIFLTLQFINDDLFDSAGFYEALCALPSGQELAADIRAVRAEPRLLAQGLLGGIHLLRDPSVPEHQLELPEGLSGGLFLRPGLRDFSARMHAFGRRVDSAGFQVWLEELYEALTRFFESHANIYAAGAMSVEAFAAHKFVNSGMRHAIRLLELANGCFLSREQHALPLVRALTHHCCHVGSLLNEIASYEKEVFLERGSNLLVVVMQKEQVELEGAVRRVAALAQHHANEVVRLREHALAQLTGEDEESRKLKAYVHGMDLLTAACWYWQVEGTSRYLSPTSPFAELLSHR